MGQRVHLFWPNASCPLSSSGLSPEICRWDSPASGGLERPPSGAQAGSLQPHFLRHTGQELGGFASEQCSVLGTVDGQDVVSSMQGPSSWPGRGAKGKGVQPDSPDDFPCTLNTHHSSSQQVPHLAHHAGRLDASMVMTGLFRWSRQSGGSPRLTLASW